jgi:hypothetical protein
MTINLSDPVTQAIFVFLSFLFIPAFSFFMMYLVDKRFEKLLKKKREMENMKPC